MYYWQIQTNFQRMERSASNFYGSFFEFESYKYVYIMMSWNLKKDETIIPLIKENMVKISLNQIWCYDRWSGLMQ